MFPRLTTSEKWLRDMNRYQTVYSNLDEGTIKDKLGLYIKTFESLSNDIDVGHQSGSGGYIKPRQLIDIKHNLFTTKEKIEVIIKQLNN